MADFIDDFMQRLARHAPDLPAAQRQALELEVRQDRGGTELGYAAKRPAWQRSQKIGESLRAHKPLAQVFAEAGISRRHGYRLLGRK